MAQLGGKQDPALRKRANETRSRALQELHAEKITLRALCDYSKTDTEHTDALYVSRLRLIDILKSKDGWTTADAERLLLESGFKVTDTIRTIRSKAQRFDTFMEIMDMPIEEMRVDSGRATITSDDWPWRGKLSHLAESTGLSVAGLLGLPEQERSSEEQTHELETSSSALSNEDLDDLFSDESSSSVDDDDLDALLGDD